MIYATGLPKLKFKSEVKIKPLKKLGFVLTKPILTKEYINRGCLTPWPEDIHFKSN